MVRKRRPSAVHEPAYQYMVARLRKAREERGLTQAQVASALGRPISFVSKCELTERRIDPVDLQMFAEIYDRPFSYFLPKRNRK